MRRRWSCLDAARAHDSNRLDNLVGGGVLWGETPREALVREGREEAGLDATLLARASTGGCVELLRDVAGGLKVERIFVFDVEVPRQVTPVNLDGEVQAFRLVAIDEALDLAAGHEMTVDAAMVTLDFARRRGLA